MILDRTTYEAWLLDRIEGNLSLAQNRELDVFLAANPGLDPDLSRLPTIDAGAADPIDWKNELKKQLPPVGAPDAVRLNEFLVARLEGDLDNAQELALDKFLYEYPELQQQAKRMVASKTGADKIPFEHKPTVKRHFPPLGMPDAHRLTDFLIAFHEGDLNKEQKRTLANYLAAHPAARHQERLVAAAKVRVERIVFHEKEGLKKREVRVIALWQRYAAAASIALLLGFVWWMMRIDQNDGPAVAESEKVQRPQGPETETLRENAGPEAETLRESGDPEGERGAKTLPEGEEKSPNAPTRADAPGQHPSSAPPVLPIGSPAPEPQLVEEPGVPDQLQPTPQLAQQPGQVPHVPEAPPQALAAEHPPMIAAAHDIGGTPIGTALANTVRQGVLATDERSMGFDRDDALAAANKAISAVTGGVGRVEVAPQGARTGWKLRLGQNLAISASKGR